MRISFETCADTLGRADNVLDIFGYSRTNIERGKSQWRPGIHAPPPPSPG